MRSGMRITIRVQGNYAQSVDHIPVDAKTTLSVLVRMVLFVKIALTTGKETNNENPK